MSHWGKIKRPAGLAQLGEHILIRRRSQEFEPLSQYLLFREEVTSCIANGWFILIVITILQIVDIRLEEMQ